MTIFGFLIRPANTVQAVATRFGVSADFIRFAIVGTMGFCWDTATVYALRHLVGLYIAGFAAYLVAATANWVANRFWTFRHRRHGAMHQQWLKFLMANLVGFVLNRGVYSIAITVSAVCHREPVFATAMGSFAGLGFNYFLSKRLVFAEVNEAP